MTEIKANENVQELYDFDYLINLTSQDMVSEIQSSLRHKYSKNIKIVVEAQPKNISTVFVYLGSWVTIYNFYHPSETYEKCSVFSGHVKILKELFGAEASFHF